MMVFFIITVALLVILKYILIDCHDAAYHICEFACKLLEMFWLYQF